MKNTYDIRYLEVKYRVDLQRISELTLIPMPTLYSWHSRITPKPFVLDLIDFRLKSYRNGEPEIQVPDPLPTIREMKKEEDNENSEITKSMFMKNAHFFKASQIEKIKN